MKTLIATLLLLLTPAIASAQVVTMRFAPRVRTLCPRGECPQRATTNIVVNSEIPQVTPTPIFQLKTTQWDNRRWTFPGTITSHLDGVPHYVPRDVLSQLSYNEKVILHNQLHNSQLERFSLLYPEYGTLVSSQEDCPDGNCPITTSSDDCPTGTCPTSAPTSSAVQSSNCPGGVCPAPTRTIRRGFRWFRRR